MDRQRAGPLRSHHSIRQARGGPRSLQGCPVLGTPIDLLRPHLRIHETQQLYEGEQLMNDITIFNHLGNDIRVMTDAQGEPWFVLKDICGALDLKKHLRRSQPPG